MNVISEIVDLPTPTGVMRTYVHRPKGEGRYPALLFYSEIFQQTGPIERSAKIMAGHGYAVLVPEVFHELNPIGTVLGYDDAGRDKGNADKEAKDVQGYDSDNAAMIDYVRKQPWCTGVIGAMGFCIGGHLAFRAALQPAVKATACFYATDLHKQVIPNKPGQHSMDRCSEINGELLMVWGRQDPHVSTEGRAEIYSKLTANNRVFTWHEFNANHAFMRDEGERYDPQLAMTGYQLALQLFGRTLKQ
jgi:carboxymethylenebutenolidase